MERKKYLQLCQQCSTLPKGCQGIRTNVPENLKVLFNHNAYYPESYLMSFSNGNAKHTALLHELNSNSVVYVPLKKVEEAIK